MKIPITLQARPVEDPAAALLLPSTSANDLFDLVNHLGLDAFPAIFATADGFLVKLPWSDNRPLAGVIRLRSLADNLFLPVDANLVPPLLPDEAQGLVSARGLVFLPGGRTLEFAHDQPLPWSAFLQIPRLQIAEWLSLPEPRTLAEELIELTSTAPPPPPDAILEQGRDDIGSESPRPSGAAGLGSKVVGGAAYGLGKGMAWLGTKLGMSGLAGAGANLLQRAFDLVPRLSERLLGQQEAALRNLLRDFREGKIEQALRRALPLNPNPSKPVGAGGNAQLPSHNLLYSLRNLLSGRQDPGSLWISPDNLFYSLQAEYRKQAEAAARRGDYRRAAFIYAKLLNDLAAAAGMLSQGGLHRDAAHIYEHSLHNLHAAAHQWQAAGEIDKAVELFVRIGSDLMAADLLRNVGEPERALVHYRRTAEKLTALKKYSEAGDIFLKRAQRPDLALAVFHEGWRTLPQTSAIPCGLALANHYAQEPNPPRFLQLLDDAEKCMSKWTVESMVHFVNHMARLSDRAAFASIAPNARDRCLLSLGDRLRQHGYEKDASRAVSQFFPADSPWSAPVARDAQFAFIALKAPRIRGIKPTPFVRLGNSTVRAVCMMPMSKDLFLGFENGEIIHHRIGTGETRSLAKEDHPIVGLLGDADEQNLIGLTSAHSDMAYLLMGPRMGKFNLEAFQLASYEGTIRLCARVVNQRSPFGGVLSADRCNLYRSDNPSWSLSVPIMSGFTPRAGLVGSLPGFPDMPWCLIFLDNHAFLQIGIEMVRLFHVECIPENPPCNTLHQPLLQGWLEPDENPGKLTVHWVTKDASLYKVSLILDTSIEQNPRPERLQTRKPVLGIQGCIERRLQGREMISLWDSVEDAWIDDGTLSNPVAAYPLEDKEILIIEANGTLMRIPRKRG